MTQVVRFLIQVDAARPVTIVDAAGAAVGQPRQIDAAGLAGPHVETLTPNKEDRFLWALCRPDEVDQVRPLHRRILDRGRPEPGDMAAYGRFLFDKLIGDDNWAAMRAQAGANKIELALLLAGDLQPLHRFPWEMMHGPDEFLARDAAITRLVARRAEAVAEPAQPRQLHVPPRVLFVVGASLNDDKLKPGAEVYGLLRQLQARDLTIHARVVQSARPGAIEDAIRVFEPDVVHFICHGDLDPDHGGYLTLPADEVGQEVKWFSQQILAALQAAKEPAPIVVLNACYSAAAAEAAETPLGDRQMGSLAAELVARGVPIVVGMGGSVADLACRLFTRRFGEALVGGEPLVAATAQGRWAAFLGRRPDRVDWVFPTVFMEKAVDAGYAPVERPEGKDPGQLLARRIKRYRPDDYPVFCGRSEFFEAYQRLFKLGSHPVLLITTKTSEPGLGRTRLLQELAAQAVRDGHLPVLVKGKEEDWRPLFPDVARLGVEILAAIGKTREWFDLPPPMGSSLLLAVFEGCPDRRQQIETTYAANPLLCFTRLLTEARQVTPGPEAETVQVALQSDLRRLVEDARAAEAARAAASGVPPAIGPSSRAVLLLDQTHYYGQALEPLLNSLLNEDGLGPPGEPVPVVLCYARGSASGTDTDSAVEKLAVRWLNLELAAFKGSEAMLAYERVMLNPNKENLHARELAAEIGATSLGETLEVVPFAFDDRAEKEPLGKVQQRLENRIGGMPSMLESYRWYDILDVAHVLKVIVIADDEIRLRKL